LGYGHEKRRNLKAPLKQANALGIARAIIIVAEKVKGDNLVLQDMVKGEQAKVPRDMVVELLKSA